MRIALTIASLSVLLAVPTFAQSFLTEELSPRAVSLGGAFVGLADDAAAALWNPAGLFTLEGIGILGRLAMPAPTTPFEIFGGAVSGGLLGIGGALWHGNKILKVPTRREQTLTLVAIGVGVRERMSAGVAVKLYDERRTGQRFHGTGVDIGLMVRFGWIWGGLAVTELLGTRLVGQRDFVELPMIVRMGTAIHLWGSRLRLLAAIDLARSEELRAIRGGLELQLLEGITLRVGWNGRELTWGGSLGVFYIVQTDFAWQADGWAVSTELAFGRR
ncbi:MAG: hypothetical protein NZ930_07400 [Candidatus Bipolaricaulota bacterium]|nr:hypothetical protein [Candidatus Bipolaricaulota bacterium]MDW8031639.1 hypothetical protein [Candidatus Bipolaricaulota bacterium]